MGYKVVPGMNGTVRNIWLGKNGIPGDRMLRIINYLKISKKNVILNISKRKEDEIISDWYESYLYYLKEKKIRAQAS